MAKQDAKQRRKRAWTMTREVRVRAAQSDVGELAQQQNRRQHRGVTGQFVRAEQACNDDAQGETQRDGCGGAGRERGEFPGQSLGP